ncbi:MAG TPA: RtcB family protein [Candidatus Limnocylindrales bacterium]|nr:RtcB family protein [Candidatus Limnocylindrales bacterium]
MTRLEPAGLNCYRIPRQGKMNADVLVYLNRALYKTFTEDQSLQQLVDAASLHGVVSPVVGMPDIHTGFGLPIGGVMAMDAAEGLVSAGAVGMDINCGVRLLRTNLLAADLDKPLLRQLISAIVDRVPSGVGKKSRHAPLISKHFENYLQQGVPFLIGQGFGRPEDLYAIEDGGVMTGAKIGAVSREAIDRGLQLSTIGGGNHFIEIGVVDDVIDQHAAESFGLRKGRLTVFIHTGSRGFGHQICNDYSVSMKKLAGKYKLEIPSPGLAAVPINSAEGKNYLSAMACAANFAFCNRQWITDDVRKVFQTVLGGNDRDYDLGLIYDVAHNTARFEEIKGKRMLIHRKGAVRALPPQHPDTPVQYRSTGHPVLIPGSMGTASYVIVAEPGVEKIYNSVNHGAGRVLSRRAAKREITVEQLKERLADVVVLGRNFKAYLDEAPQAYKDIDSVVDTFVEIGYCRKVARLLPLAVIKGEGDDN